MEVGVRTTSFVGAALVAVALGGCATVTRGTTEKVQVISDPPGAVVTTSIGVQCAATPCTLEVKRKAEFTVLIRKPGYADETVAVKTKLGSKGGVNMAGNLLMPGGTVGLVTDAVTGAGLDHVPNPVTVRLRRLGHGGARGVRHRHAPATM
jgi:hypothetical protein